MGVLSFVEGLRQQKLAQQQAELERQARMAEIAARGSQAIAEQNNAAQIAEQAKKNEAFRNWQSSAMADIKRKSDLSTVLHAQNPEMSIAESLPAAGLEMKNIELQPQLLQSSAAKAKNAFNAGLLPTMQPLGESSGQADVLGAKARGAGNLNEYNTNVARSVTQPIAARAADEAAAAQSNQMATSANATIPGLTRVIPAQQEATIAGAGAQRAQDLFKTKVSSLLNPAAEAGAQNAGNLASSARSGLEVGSGGVLSPGVGNALVGNPMIDPSMLKALIPLITSAMTNRNATPTTATSPTALPARQPINLKNLGITLPME